MTDKPYHQFSTAELMDDADFFRYIKFNSPQDAEFWDAWQLANPTHQDNFRAAKLQLGVILGAREFQIPAGLQDELLADINSSINAYESRKVRKTRLRFIAGAAASLLVALGAGLWYSQSTITVHAGYGQQIAVSLPEGSVVTLNANSTLTYPRALRWLSRREVKLDGEGFFKVNHLNARPEKLQRGDVFIASTANLRVRVLGTEFNLKARPHQSNVTLIKGSVEVTAIASGRKQILRVGQTFQLGKTGELVRTNKALTTHTDWMEGKATFQQTSVAEIINEFEDLYGYKITLEDPSLGAKLIDGSISLRDEQAVLFTLKNILNVDVLKQGKTIYLKSRK